MEVSITQKNYTTLTKKVLPMNAILGYNFNSTTPLNIHSKIKGQNRRK